LYCIYLYIYIFFFFLKNVGIQTSLTFIVWKKVERKSYRFETTWGKTTFKSL